MPDLISTPAQIVIDPSGTPITINKDQQMGDAVVTLNKSTFGLRSNKSSEPVSYVQTASPATMVIMITDMAIKLQIAALAIGTNVVINTTKRKVLGVDNAGLAIVGRKVVLKPYIGETVSTQANDWVTFPNGQIVDFEGTLNYGLESQQVMRLEFMACPDNVTGQRYILGDETA